MSEKLGTAVLDLVADKSAMSKTLSDAKKESETTIRSMGESAKQMGAKLTRTLTPIALGLGVAFKKAFDEFDAGADALAAGTGKVGKELEGLVASMKNVGGRVTQPLSEVGKVMAELAQRTGATGKPLEDLTKKVLDLARITGGDAQASVAGLTRLFGDWSIATKDQGFAIDKMTALWQETGIEVQQLSELMVQFGSPLRQLGLGFNETAAMLAKFEQEGVNIQTVMPGLRQALGNFAEAGREPAAALKETIEAIKAAGSTGDAYKVKIGNLGGALDVFGKRAGADLVAAIREGRFELDDLIGVVENARGTTDAAAEATLDYSDKLSMWRNKIIGVIGPFGEMGAAVMGAVASIGPALFGFGVVADSTFGKLIGGWIKSAATAVASAAVHVAQWVWMGVQALLAAAKIALAWLIALGPIALVIAAVVGLAALIFLNFEKIKEWIGKAWQWVKTTTSNVWNAIIGFLKDIWNRAVEATRSGLQRINQWVIDRFNDAVTWIKQLPGRVRDIIVDLWDRAVAATREGLQRINQWIVDRFNDAVAWIKELPGRVRSAIVDVWDRAWLATKLGLLKINLWIRDQLDKLVQWFKDLPGNIVDAVGDLSRLLVDAGRAAINGLWEGMKNALPGPLGLAASIAGKIADLKGPLSYDLKVLVPNGEALMAGLREGLAAGFEADVAPMMGAITASIAAPPAAVGDSYTFNGNLSFPNVKDGRDAEGFLTDLRQVVGQGV